MRLQSSEQVPVPGGSHSSPSSMRPLLHSMLRQRSSQVPVPGGSHSSPSSTRRLPQATTLQSTLQDWSPSHSSPESTIALPQDADEPVEPVSVEPSFAEIASVEPSFAEPPFVEFVELESVEVGSVELVSAESPSVELPPPALGVEFVLTSTGLSPSRYRVRFAQASKMKLVRPSRATRCIRTSYSLRTSAS